MEFYIRLSCIIILFMDQFIPISAKMTTYGRVSMLEEEKTLKEEGIDFIKIPMPPQSDTDA